MKAKGFKCLMKFSGHGAGRLGLFSISNAAGKVLSPDEAEGLLRMFTDAFTRAIDEARTELSVQKG